MKLITVFTPTYNRAYCLQNVYHSLVAQTNPNFIWMIIDDGSTDNTKQKVDAWISENKIEICYIFQNNQGMHGGHNTAYQNINTELNVCIDSDDFMPIDAIENIISIWDNNNNTDIAGIIGLDAFKDGTIVGSTIPTNIKSSGLSDLYLKHGIKGDKKIVLRTDVVKKFPPYPIFPEERFVPLGVLYLMIDQQYKCICSNNVFCIIEYLPDGSSLNIYNQYKKHPKGFRYSRIIEMKYSHNFFYTFTRAMHLISASLFLKEWNVFKDNPNPFTTFFAIPFGVCLHWYILFKTTK